MKYPGKENVHAGEILAVKIGGRIAEEETLTTALAGDLADLHHTKALKILLVHGGSITINALQERYAVVPRFQDGLRQTAMEEMPLVDMALAGGVNKNLVRVLRRAGLDAWGISGADAGIMEAESLDTAGVPQLVAEGAAEEQSTEKQAESKLDSQPHPQASEQSRADGLGSNRTGRPGSVNSKALEIMWDFGFTPVFAPPATGTDGLGMNVNADEAALALALALPAHRLLFLSDVPGVLDGETILRQLSPEEAEAGIASGVITGGMIPKVRSACAALNAGVDSIHIGRYQRPGDLQRILSGESGTRIKK